MDTTNKERIKNVKTVIKMVTIMTVIRIVVVGEGREKFGHVFLADTGTSNGDITGQTRPINTVDFKVSDLKVCTVYCTVLYCILYSILT